MENKFKQAIMLLEKQIEENSLEMKILAFDFIRKGNLGVDTVGCRNRFAELEQQNIALEKAIDQMLFLEV